MDGGGGGFLSELIVTQLAASVLLSSLTASKLTAGQTADVSTGGAFVSS